jgi:hypothetical protein
MSVGHTSMHLKTLSVIHDPAARKSNYPSHWLILPNSGDTLEDRKLTRQCKPYVTKCRTKSSGNNSDSILGWLVKRGPEYSSKTFITVSYAGRIVNPLHCEHLKSCTKKYEEKLKCRWECHVGKTELQEQQHILDTLLHFFSCLFRAFQINTSIYYNLENAQNHIQIIVQTPLWHVLSLIHHPKGIYVPSLKLAAVDKNHQIHYVRSLQTNICDFVLHKVLTVNINCGHTLFHILWFYV